MYRKFLRSLCLLAAALIACTSAGPRSEVRERILALPGAEYRLANRPDVPVLRQELDAHPERIAAVLPVALRELGFGVDPKTSRDRQVATPFLRIERQLYDGEPNSRYLDCGETAAGRPAADMPDVKFRIVTRLDPAPDERTLVNVWVEGESWRPGTQEAPVPCAGTGELERRVVGRVVWHAVRGRE